jgi:hypothetical protein
MQCKFTKDNWNQCNAHAMKDSDYCYLHNSNISKQEKKDVQSQWGKANLHTIKKELPVIEVSDIKSIMCLLQDTVNRVRSWDMDIKVANCIWFLSSHLMKAYELEQIENKLDKVRQAIGK